MGHGPAPRDDHDQTAVTDGLPALDRSAPVAEHCRAYGSGCYAWAVNR
ncbi:hypothetical protein [Micromonospora sp. NPDC005205]